MLLGLLPKTLPILTDLLPLSAMRCHIPLYLCPYLYQSHEKPRSLIPKANFHVALRIVRYPLVMFSISVLQVFFSPPAMLYILLTCLSLLKCNLLENEGIYFVSCLVLRASDITLQIEGIQKKSVECTHIKISYFIFCIFSFNVYGFTSLVFVICCCQLLFNFNFTLRMCFLDFDSELILLGFHLQKFLETEVAFIQRSFVQLILEQSRNQRCRCCTKIHI